MSIFNFKNKEIIYNRYIESLDRLKKVEGIDVYTSEAILTTQEKSIVSELNNKHYLHRISSPFIVTHNLCNAVINHLPDDWRYVLLLDSDIEFINDDWVINTIVALEKFSLINPYTHASRLNKDGSECLELRSFGYMYNKHNNNVSGVNNDGYHYDCSGGWWPGYAIAFNREYYNATGGIYDKSISGKNDIISFNCAINNLECLKTINKVPNFLKSVTEHRDKILNFKEYKGVGYAENKIKHHYHGDYTKRNYSELDKLIINVQYNPYTDLIISDTGNYNLVVKDDRQLKLKNGLIKYFDIRHKTE